MRALVDLDSGRVADALATLCDALAGASRDPAEWRMTRALGRALIATGRGAEAVGLWRDNYGWWLS